MHKAHTEQMFYWNLFDRIRKRKRRHRKNIPIQFAIFSISTPCNGSFVFSICARRFFLIFFLFLLVQFSHLLWFRLVVSRVAHLDVHFQSLQCATNSFSGFSKWHAKFISCRLARVCLRSFILFLLCVVNRSSKWHSVAHTANKKMRHTLRVCVCIFRSFCVIGKNSTRKNGKSQFAFVSSSNKIVGNYVCVCLCVYTTWNTIKWNFIK